MKSKFRKGFVQESKQGKFFIQVIKLDASTKIAIKHPIPVANPTKKEKKNEITDSTTSTSVR